MSDINSHRIANYEMEVWLDHDKKTIKAEQRLTWVNHSEVAIDSLPFYMYFNAFKNTESTFMKSAEGNIFGDDISTRTEETWGWAEINSIVANNQELVHKAKYIQHDGNLDDQSVICIYLNESVSPGDTLILDMKYDAKIPQIFARAGYEREDFFNMVHWFPQVGVLEEVDNIWQWNCHQFHRRTEFFGEFGNYDVTLHIADHLIVGASGCLVDTKSENGINTFRYIGQDIIDFAWCAYPHFCVVEDKWEHVDIRLLIPPEHSHLSDRVIRAVKHSLKYMTENVGPYPYNTITVMDPPMLGLKAGFMEYPTFITIGAFHIFPEGVRTLESLVAHEFAHQYFMGIVASNEKEEPWLDEGFVTYHEDKIMESLYGEEASMFNIGGYKVCNSSFSRQEYTNLPNPSTGAVARQGWEIKDGFKGITYSKTATVLKTIEGLLGNDLMIKLMQKYYNEYKFTHPKANDFLGLAKQFILDNGKEDAFGDVDCFFDQLIYGTGICDYAVGNISHFQPVKNLGIFDNQKEKTFSSGDKNDRLSAKIVLYRKGDVIIPVEVLMTFEDGTSKTEYWDGKNNYQEYIYHNSPRIAKVEIDPEKKVFIDIDFNNNSYEMKRNQTALLKVSSKAMYWVTQALQSLFVVI